MIAKLLSLCFLSLVLAMNSGLVCAKDLVFERAIVEDVSSDSSLAQIKDAKFTVIQSDVIGQGFRRSAVWLRLKVDVPESRPQLTLRIRPNVLDSVTLYLPSESGIQPVLSLDERTAQAGTSFHLPTGPHTLYLRIRSESFLIMQVHVIPSAEATASHLGDRLKTGAILAIYVLLMIGALSYLFSNRSGIAAFLLLNLLASLLLYLARLDYSSELLAWNWINDKSTLRLLTIVNLLCACLLTQAVLVVLEKPRLRLAVLCVAGVFTTLAVSFYFAPFEALRISGFVGAFFTLTTCVALTVWLLRQVPSWRELQVSHVLFGLTVIAFDFVVVNANLQVLGLLPVSALLLDSLTLRGLFLPLLIFNLAWHVSKRRDIYAEAQTVARVAAEVQYRETKNRLDQQSEFVGMLVHEFKTPLYTIQLAATSLSSRRNVASEDSKRFDNIFRAADDMNFIIERCAQVDQIEQGQLPFIPTLVNLDTVLHETRPVLGSERLVFSGPKGLKLQADYQYLRIILLNLVTNALKYSPPESPVHVDLEPLAINERSLIALKVTNVLGKAGAPDPARVFTRYYRGEGAKHQVGTGLGLWLSQTLALKLGSKLDCVVDGQTIQFVMKLELS